MRRYETTFIIDPDLPQEGRVQVIEKIKALIEKEKGIIVDVEEWGQRKLAYEIGKKVRGYYLCVNFCGSAKLVEELERTSRLDDKIMKYMTIMLQDNVNPETVMAEIAATQLKKEEAAKQKAMGAEISAPVDEKVAAFEGDDEEETEIDKEEA